MFPAMPSGRLLAFSVVLFATLSTAAPSDASAAAARVLKCDGLEATIVVPAGGGLVEGTPGDDVIYGSGRADTIVGNGGNDTICGRGGNDVIYAGELVDDLDPAACAPLFEDELVPVVYVDGGSGDDLICGPVAIDGGYWQVEGGSGNDLIGWASGVSEEIDGGSGADTIVGTSMGTASQALASFISGGSGNDSIEIAPASVRDATLTTLDIEVDGGEGGDVIVTTARAGVGGELAGGTGVDTCTVTVVDEPPAVFVDDTCES